MSTSFKTGGSTTPATSTRARVRRVGSTRPKTISSRTVSTLSEVHAQRCPVLRRMSKGSAERYSVARSLGEARSVFTPTNGVAPSSPSSLCDAIRVVPSPPSATTKSASATWSGVTSSRITAVVAAPRCSSSLVIRSTWNMCVSCRSRRRAHGRVVEPKRPTGSLRQLLARGVRRERRLLDHQQQAVELDIADRLLAPGPPSPRRRGDCGASAPRLAKVPAFSDGSQSAFASSQAKS